MKIYQYTFTVEITWHTLKSTGQVLSKQEADWYRLADRSLIEYQTKRVNIVTLEGKKDSEVWGKVCAFTAEDIQEQPTMIEVRENYCTPDKKPFYSTWGFWQKLVIHRTGK